MGASSGTVLEITIISCENLRVTEDPYVVVRAESLESCATKMAKDSGRENSSLFSWNEKFMLNMPVHARSITFEVQCNRFKGLRPVGVARVAVSDFLGGGDAPENCLHVLSYRLKDWEGKGNGVIRFAVRVVNKGSSDRFMGINVGGNEFNEVVIDIPFSYPNVNI